MRLRWRHIIINTHGTWLHADERGLRSRGHRIHSSGDYRNPPPPDEHKGLRMYMKARSAPPTVLSHEFLAIVGVAILNNLIGRGWKVRAIAVTPTHVHILVQLPDHVSKVKEIIGWSKRFGTKAARRTRPTLQNVEIWADGESYKAVNSQEHYNRVVIYILVKQGADAWTWSLLKSDKQR